MDIEEVVKGFLESGKKCVFIRGDNQKERYRIAGELCCRLGNVFVYSCGDLRDFERADPYVVCLTGI